MLNIVLFGPPGAGKGTQSKKLSKELNLKHLSTGDVFRYNLKNETDLGLLAKKYISKGDLVPDDVTIKMLETEIDKASNVEGFIFDGFPRTTKQAEALDKLLDERKQSVSLMLALEVEENELERRLLERGKESGRKDDANSEVIQKRIKVYNDETLPIIDFYKEQGKFESINGIGVIDDIYKQLLNKIESKKE